MVIIFKFNIHIVDYQYLKIQNNHKINDNFQKKSQKNRLSFETASLEYSKNSEDVNATYWKTQLVSYQKSIDSAKAEVHNTILKLSEKGVNVTEIEKQHKVTAENISKIEAKLEALSLIEIDLIQQYEEEKKARLQLTVKTDHVKDRELENRNLFNHFLLTTLNEKVIANKHPEIPFESRKFASR
ncbi:MAG: hypothetical protein LC112_11815 [Flavobacteriales bacterium]|nr:hypothetical protein [Flavobacteriales bacterium]